jgi:hypothetical protein
LEVLPYTKQGQNVPFKPGRMISWDPKGIEKVDLTKVIGALEAVEESMLPFLLALLLGVAWLGRRGWLLIHWLLWLVGRGSVFVHSVGIHFE